MGFFSKTCAKTNLPVIAPMLGYPSLNLVVALTPDGRKVSGSYDGYGRVDGHDFVKEWETVKFILVAYYNGETYEELGNSGDENAQGFFMADAFLDYCIKHGPFKNRAEYEQAFDKYADW
jgi:hypothetical protein